MKKDEYLLELKNELKKNKVSDAEDIMYEYEQHFAFKLADGFTEEEIAAKLAKPKDLVIQFADEARVGKSPAGGKVLLRIALLFVALFEIMAYILFFAWAVAVSVLSLTSVVLGVCLIGAINFVGLIPYMPYASALVVGICLLSFAVFLAGGSYYFFAYAKQLAKASIRWHKNMLSDGLMPSLPWNPQFNAKTSRRLRTVLLWSVTVFGGTFILGMILSMILSGALGFWHAWNWFV